MSKKAWIIFAGVCVALLAGLIYFSSKNRIDVSGVNTNQVVAESEQSGAIGDHVFGNADSKVLFIEYGDFQCPGCGGIHPTIKRLTEKYEKQIAFVFRNFPLTSIHPNARAAAAAAESAGLQGSYWDMHNKLFEEQTSWGDLSSNERTNTFASYAEQLGLNVDTFKSDMGSERVNQKINFDTALGKKEGVSSTPSFFLNGKSMTDITNDQGGIDETKLEQQLIQTMKDNGIEVPKE